MNKGNKILLAILAFVLVCVIGYALFSDTITVTGSATAQGGFSISTTCVKGFSPTISSFAEGTSGSLGDVKNSSCTVSGNSVTFNAEFGYPGSYQYYTLQFKNTGTIDALFANDSHLYNQYTGEMKVYLHSNDSLYKTVTLPSDDNFAINFANIMPGEAVIVKKAGGYIVSGDNETGRIVELDGKEYVKVKAGETLEILIVSVWPDNDNNQLKDYYAKTTYNQEFPFIQYTTEAVDKNDSYFCITGC